MEPEGDFAIIVNTSTVNHISPAPSRLRGELTFRRKLPDSGEYRVTPAGRVHGPTAAGSGAGHVGSRR